MVNGECFLPVALRTLGSYEEELEAQIQGPTVTAGGKEILNGIRVNHRNWRRMSKENRSWVKSTAAVSWRRR